MKNYILSKKSLYSSSYSPKPKHPAMTEVEEDSIVHFRIRIHVKSDSYLLRSPLPPILHPCSPLPLVAE